MKDQLECQLELERTKCMKVVAEVINNRIWSYYIRKKYLRIRAAIIMIQKVYKVSAFVFI